MVYSVEYRILMENLYKFKKYGAQNLFENFLAKVGWFLVRISCKEDWETLAVQERVKEADDVAVCALMITLILSVKWFWVRKVHQRVTEPHVKSRQIEIHHSLIYRIVRQNLKKRSVQELTVANCACTELAHESCYIVSQHLLWTSYFSLMNFVWKLMDDIVNTRSDRLLLCFAFISNWVVTNFSVGFCCIMFMPTVV